MPIGKSKSSKTGIITSLSILLVNVISLCFILAAFKPNSDKSSFDIEIAGYKSSLAAEYYWSIVGFLSLIIVLLFISVIRSARKKCIIRFKTEPLM